jgi:hypothetical protein
MNLILVGKCNSRCAASKRKCCLYLLIPKNKMMVRNIASSDYLTTTNSLEFSLTQLKHR